jgi:hypothetical protein
LREQGPRSDAALTDLRIFLTRGLSYASSGRDVVNSNIEDFAQEALLKILEKQCGEEIQILHVEGANRSKTEEVVYRVHGAVERSPNESRWMAGRRGRVVVFTLLLNVLEGEAMLKPKMREEKILTKHPLGKSGKNIDRRKYDALKEAILSALGNKELTHTELFDQLDKSLRGKFSGNISWYGETVKLDLEARKIIEKTSSKPQRYRLK